MITKQSITVLPSVAGHYDIQYPDHNAVPLAVPAGERLVELSWLSPDEGWKPYVWHKESGLLVVWLNS